MSAPGSIELDEGVSLLDVVVEGFLIQNVEALVGNGNLGLSDGFLKKETIHALKKKLKLVINGHWKFFQNDYVELQVKNAETNRYFLHQSMI